MRPLVVLILYTPYISCAFRAIAVSDLQASDKEDRAMMRPAVDRSALMSPDRSALMSPNRARNQFMSPSHERDRRSQLYKLSPYPEPRIPNLYT